MKILTQIRANNSSNDVLQQSSSQYLFVIKLLNIWGAFTQKLQMWIKDLLKVTADSK